MTSELHLLLSISSRTQVRIFRQRVNTEKKATAVSQKLKKKKGNGIFHVSISDFGHMIDTSPQELFYHMTGKWSYHPKKKSIFFLLQYFIQWNGTLEKKKSHYFLHQTKYSNVGKISLVCFKCVYLEHIQLQAGLAVRVVAGENLLRKQT